MKRVLILDGAIYRDLYHPTAHWRQLLGEVPADSVHLPSGESVPDLAGYTHLIITGSEATIRGDDPWIEVEAETVRRAASLNLPMLGSCFGHQMLARALAGRAHVGASPTPEVGWVGLRHTGVADPLLQNLPDPLSCFVFHLDEVRNPPPPWQILATSPGCTVQAMRLEGRPFWGLQAHPEIPPEEARAFLEGILRYHPELEPLVRPAQAMPVADDGAAREIVERFLGQ